MELLKVNDIKKTYVSRLGGTRVQALKGVTFSVEKLLKSSSVKPMQ